MKNPVLRKLPSSETPTIGPQALRISEQQYSANITNRYNRRRDVSARGFLKKDTTIRLLPWIGKEFLNHGLFGESSGNAE